MMGRDSVEAKITDELRQNRNNLMSTTLLLLRSLSGLNVREMEYGSERSFLSIACSRIIA